MIVTLSRPSSWLAPTLMIPALRWDPVEDEWNKRDCLAQSQELAVRERFQ